jgi:hypothetical protein
MPSIRSASLLGGCPALEAGSRLKAETSHDLANSEIDGITGFGGGTFAIHTSTSVSPGQLASVAAHLRLLIEAAMDGDAAALKAPRMTLVPPLAACLPGSRTASSRRSEAVYAAGRGPMPPTA